MSEEIISMLDGMGADYTEDPETGDLAVDLEPLDKVQVLDLIKALSDMDFDYTVDGMSLTVMVDAEALIEEPTELPEELPELSTEEDAQTEALSQMMGM